MKKVLFPILAVVLALSLALPMAAVVGAQSVYIETLYLSNTLGASDGHTQLYEVVLDDATPKADLTPLPDVGWGAGIIPLEHADAIACTPDGTKIYAIDDPNGSTGPREIGVYDLTVSSWTSLGNIKMSNGTTDFRTTDQLAFAQDGTLYVTRNEDENLYTIDIDSLSATYLRVSAVGQVQVGGSAVNINGADIVFDAANWCWLFTAGSIGVNPAGLYKFSQSTGPTTASLVGANAQKFTGVAIRGGGAGDLVGSETTNDSIAIISKTDGSTGTNYPMFLSSVRYSGYIYGDMTVGELAVEVGEPSLTIDKEADVEEALEGDTITYTYLVENTGNVPLDNLVVTDSLITPVTEVDEDLADGYNDGDSNTDGIFDPGEIWEFEAEYTVPWFTAGPVVNIATATGYWDDTPVSATDDESVDILHNPDIEVTKSGPPETDPDQEGFGYFQTVDAEYTYTVTNTGDCALIVELEDSVYGILEPDDGDTYLLPEHTWHYTESDTLICEGYTMTIFTNTAIVVGEDALEAQVWDMACWNVVVFQWQPRTIGYWGNWENHYTSDEFEELFDAADDASGNVGEYGDVDTYTDVNSFLLGKPPKLSGTEKAEFLMEKQFLATWLNVQAYMDWVTPSHITDFTGTADVGMDPDATVYLTGDAEVELFGSTPTVMEILDIIEADKGDWYTDGLSGNFKTAQIVLDKLNNAEDNAYRKFMDPDFNPSACSTCLLVGDWLINVNDGAFMHDMTIASQDVDGNLSGSGGYPESGPPYNSGYDWTLTGQLTGDSVTLVITYTNSYTTTLDGTITSCNSMSGSGTSGVATWVATRV